MDPACAQTWRRGGPRQVGAWCHGGGRVKRKCIIQVEWEDLRIVAVDILPVERRGCAFILEDEETWARVRHVWCKCDTFDDMRQSIFARNQPNRRTCTYVRSIISWRMEMRQSCVGACPNPSQYVQPFLVLPMPLHLRFTVVHVIESSDGQAFCSKVRHARSLAEETEYDVLSSTQRFGFAVSTVSIMWASSTWSPRPTLRTTFLAKLRPIYQQVTTFETRISSLVHLS